MAFTGRTPESLIPRSDSRNPATTCKGITKSGRPCRRPIDSKASEDNGVLAVTSVISDDSEEEDVGAAAYFCWQHKDQAESLAAQGPATTLYPLKERNSIDTLVERLGVLEVNDAPQEQGPRRKRRTSGSRPPRRINRPPTWENVEGPLMSIPGDVMAVEKRRTRPPKPAPTRQKKSFWAGLCCGSADEEEIEVVRHKRRTSQHVVPENTPQMQQVPIPQRPSRRSSLSHPKLPPQPISSVPGRKPLGEKTTRPLNNRVVSATSRLLQFIPPSLSPQLTSTLLAEASKPISPHDEDGYIYIFWLTPEALAAPSNAASTLLTAPARPDHGRRTSDLMRQYSVKPTRGGGGGGGGEGAAKKDTIFLKIGRANNVHRRMNEWTRQCGYNLSLVRYYPYVPSSGTPSPTPSPGRRVSGGVRKVPHAHRVERLVHLELAEQRVVKSCEACGKTHKEWFEVEASKEGIKKVDEVVKRWVDWAEKANE
ncbi:hypothetical protein HBI82_181960 [Parastagonospora nodorum]|nr:hypothetical protein HBH52_226140 [Parastagonospora nodorum]KAH5993521.1 hypothetical protein HBI82_181960 [Parastagonospora nodorum]